MSNLINDKIKLLLKDRKSCVWATIIKSVPNFNNYVIDILKNNSKIFSTKTEVIYSILNDIDIDNRKKCSICGEMLPMNKIINNRIYCSKHCSDICPERKKRISLLKHTKEYQERYKNTCLERFGVDNPTKCKQIAEKVSKKYNSHSDKQRKEINEKREQTVLQKYGKAYVSQTSEIIDKIINTRKINIEEKQKVYREKCSINTYKRFTRFNDKVLPTFNIEEFIKMGGNCYLKSYEWKCVKCGKVFSSKITRHKNFIPRCPICNPPNREISKTEIDLFEYIKSLGVICHQSNREIIKPLELDIVIPSKKLAIEFNGNYWHSTAVGYRSSMHLFKTKKTNEAGYRLIHIFEDEWNSKRKIVKARLRNILGLTKYKIGARECEVREISFDIKRKFLEKYHIQGDCHDSIRYGLFYKNRLVAVMTFGKNRFRNNNENKEQIELIRYATISNFNIVGGAGKLLKYFQRNNHEFKSIISYADKRWSEGTLYKKLGFVLKYTSSPNYYYLNNFSIRHNRMEFQKHKLKDKLEHFDENLTEAENMKMNGYYKIYDCGNYVFELIL